MAEVIDGDLIFSGEPPAGTFVLAYHRPALQIPRRDLVFARSDSLGISVTVVQRDDPDAPALLLTGGLGGPALRMTVRRPAIGLMPDYGALSRSAVLSVINATASTTANGTFNLVAAPAAMADWPTRCYFEIQLNNPGGTTSRILAHGMLHISGGSTVSYSEIPLTTDDGQPVLDDDAVALDIV